MTIQAMKKKITPILKRQGVTRAAFFGSVARGEMKKRSDVDILILLEKNKTFFDLMRLKLSLEELLGRKVDLLEYEAVKPILRNSTLSEQKIIYDESEKKS